MFQLSKGEADVILNRSQFVTGSQKHRDPRLREVDFFPNLKTLTPDLLVSFLAADGSFIKTFWEYDAGTEGIAELVRKVERYAAYKDKYEITFVFDTRVQQAVFQQFPALLFLIFNFR